jgi:hypothetical protein
MPAIPHRLVLSLAMLASPAAVVGQRPTYTVGGVGADYASLPAAVAAVPAGSVLLVQPGVHEGFSTGKPLRILFDFDETTGSVQPAPGAGHTITITGLPPGDPFVLSGRNAAVLGGSLGGIRVVNCTAPVILQGLDVDAASATSGLEIKNAAAVHVHRSELVGSFGVLAQDALLSVCDSVIAGTAGAGGVLTRVRCHSARNYWIGTAQSGLRMYRCTAQLANDGVGLIAVLGTTDPVEALEVIDCQVQGEPATLGLAPANGAAPVFQLLGGWSYEEVPLLAYAGGQPGTVASVLMTSNQPRFGAIFFGLPAAPPTALGFGTVYLDLAAPILLAFGACDAAGLAVDVQVPANPSLLGDVYHLQGGVLDSVGDILPSGPAFWVAL